MVSNELLQQLQRCHCISHYWAEPIQWEFHFDVNALPVIRIIRMVNTS
jgi:hypothetical protein